MSDINRMLINRILTLEQTVEALRRFETPIMRDRLTADRTYYVRTDGNDSNDGRSNTAAGAFLTIQRAVDVVCRTLDLAQYTVTIQVGNGTYTGQIFLGNYVGAAGVNTPQVIIQGDTATPSNVVLQVTTGNQTVLGAYGISNWWRVRGVRIVANVTGGVGVMAQYGSRLFLGNIEFGACGLIHARAAANGVIYFTQAVTINGAAIYSLFSEDGGQIVCAGQTFTLSGTLPFDIFAVANAAKINAVGATFTGGTITGQRYLAQFPGGLIYGDANANKFPGSIAGTPAPGVLSASGGYYN